MISLKICWVRPSKIFYDVLDEIIDRGHSLLIFETDLNVMNEPDRPMIKVSQNIDDAAHSDLILFENSDDISEFLVMYPEISKKSFWIQSSLSFNELTNNFPSATAIIALATMKNVLETNVNDIAELKEHIVTFITKCARQEKLSYLQNSVFTPQELVLLRVRFIETFSEFYNTLFRQDSVFITEKTLIGLTFPFYTRITEVNLNNILAENKFKIILPSQVIEWGNSNILKTYASLEGIVKGDYIELKLSSGIFYKDLLYWYQNFLDKKEFLSPIEVQELISIQNCNRRHFEGSNIIDVFQRQVDTFPDKIAARFDKYSITYANLNKRSNQIARYLKEQHGKSLKGKGIAILMHKSLDLIASILGILKTGAYYIPIDRAYPKERIKTIVLDSNPVIILTDDLHETATYLEKINYIPILSVNINLEHYSDDKLNIKIASDDIGYIIYTSGSTGTPKGVVISHKNILNLAFGEGRACQINSHSVLLSIASIGFDAFGWDFYGTMLNGAELFIAPDDIQLDPEKLSSIIGENRITIATLTPAVLSLLDVSISESLQTLIVMGDKSSKELLERWSKVIRVINGYGPTETTIAASLGEYIPSETSAYCIGYPLPNYAFYILSAEQKVLPKGIIGELYISGLGVGLGYINRDDLTTEKFVSISLDSSNAPIRLYKTGDLVYQNEKDQFEFVGRNDFQVKIRGVRIEVQEIESILNNHPKVLQSIIIASGTGVNTFLVAYVLFKEPINNDQDIQTYLARFVHPAAIPKIIVPVEQFNLTSNGKIDRKKLPIISDNILQKHQTEPRNDIEYHILKIFQNVVSNENIGIQDNFFYVGGHSLTASQVIGKVNQKFKTNIKVSDFFLRATVEDLAKYITEHNKENHQKEVITLIDRRGPLTFSQERLWYLYQLDTKDTSYNLPLAYVLKGKLNLERLNTSLKIVFSKHEAFRTVFEQTEEGPIQIVLENYHPEVIYNEDSDQNIQQKLSTLSKGSFELETKPPVRIYLIKLALDQYILFFVKHNIITDAWSEGLIIKDLIAIYNNSSITGLPYITETHTPQCIDIAAYQRKHQTKKSLQNEIQYWETKLKGHEVLDFPTHFRPTILEHSGRRVNFMFNSVGWNSLKKIANEQCATSFAALMTLFKIWVSKYTGQYDVLLGTAHSGREPGISEFATGFFVNTLPLRTKLDPDKDFLYALSNIVETCIGAFSAQSVPFEWIVEVANAERFLNKNPLFQIMVVLQNADETELQRLADSITIDKLPIDPQSAMFDMVWNFREEKKSLYVDLDYNTILFEELEILNFCKTFDYLLSTISKFLTQPIKTISINSPDMLNEIVSKGTSTIQTIISQDDNVIHRILTQSQIYKDQIIVQFENETYSYSYICAEAKKICAFIQNTVLSSKSVRVGICLDRSEKVVAAVIGILMSGGCYVPIDPLYPRERIHYIISDAQLDLVISDEVLESDDSIHISYSSMINHSYVTKDTIIQHNDTAYIMYTSGTTGRPKGVVVTHKNLINLCDDFSRRLKLSSKDTLYSLTTISFDIFGLELFCPLISGAKLIIASSEVSKNPVKLVNQINALQPTIIQATPTMWNAIAEHIKVSNLTVLCGGEYMSLALLNKLQRISKCILNVYGPTETTIWSTVKDVTYDNEISIGSPIQNTSCFIVDESNQISPFDGIGELAIGGDGVAVEYLNRPELTHSIFKTINVNNRNIRIYKTGDKVSLRSDGNFYYHSRKDNQVKLRGNRIELGEIETIINQYPAVEISACRIWGDGVDAYIAAYIVLKDGTSSENFIEILRMYLVEKLPSIMIPTYIQIMTDLPKTDNNKLDRKKLPEPIDKQVSLNENKYIQPDNETETIIQEIWQEIIGLKGISVTDNFFMTGGNSLHIPTIIYEMQKRFAIELTIREFILNSTIRDLAKIIEPKHCGEMHANT
jgi:amino acid adenylation domain-containing protein